MLQGQPFFAQQNKFRMSVGSEQSYPSPPPAHLTTRRKKQWKQYKENYEEADMVAPNQLKCEIALLGKKRLPL
jgi:hypothetical protein